MGITLPIPSWLTQKCSASILQKWSHRLNACKRNFAFQFRRSVADFAKIVKGFGMLPNKFLQKSARLKFCKTHEWVPPCIACQVWFYLGEQNGFLQKIAKCTYTCCACYSSFPIVASAISLNGNRRQPPPCLPKSETDGRCQWRRSRSSWPLTAAGCFATCVFLNEEKDSNIVLKQI